MLKAGQEVVSVYDHVNKAFKKGMIFIIREVAKAPCKCREYVVDIGITKIAKWQRCQQCNKCFRKRISKSWWFDPKHFVPIESDEAMAILEEIEIEESIQELVKIELIKY